MTDKLHFDDLTQITCPRGMLDDDTWARLDAWPHGWERFTGRAWVDASFAPDDTVFSIAIRAKPDPGTMDVYPWEHLHPDWKWCARDDDGSAWAYSEKPYVVVVDEGRWIDRRGDWICVSGVFVAYEPGTCGWEDSLQQRPEGK
jgi:hypothetical protein